MGSAAATRPDIGRRPRVIVGAAVLLILAGAGVGAFRHAALWLVVADSERPVDAAVVLAGNPALRAPRAAILYRAGLARRVVLTTTIGPSPLLVGIVPPEVEQARAILIRLGVPDSAIIVLPDTVASTRDEAVAVSGHLPLLGSRLAIVTSAVHTRRARCVFRRSLGHQATIVAVPAYDTRYQLGSWWRSEAGLQAVFVEWAKTLYHAPC